jgi:hypothetical protein
MDSPAVLLGGRIPTTIVDGTTGWPLKFGKLPADIDKVVALYDTPGQSPNPRWRLDYPGVQALVRSTAHDYAGGYTKVREVRDALLGLDSVTVGSERIVSVTCLGDINYIGPDENSRPIFSVNFRMIIEPSSGTNRDPL